MARLGRIRSPKFNETMPTTRFERSHKGAPPNPGFGAVVMMARSKAYSHGASNSPR